MLCDVNVFEKLRCYPSIQNDPLGRAFSKSFVFGDRKGRLRAGAYPTWIKRCVFKKIRIRVVWTLILKFCKDLSPRLRSLFTIINSSLPFSTQISSLPFPFASEAQFERSIRQPLGKTWNTPSGSAKLTQPKVSTLIGTIIDPIKKTKEIEKVDVSNLKGDGNFISCKRKFRKK